jgi:hypothetical protein
MLYTRPVSVIPDPSSPSEGSVPLLLNRLLTSLPHLWSTSHRRSLLIALLSVSPTSSAGSLSTQTLVLLQRLTDDFDRVPLSVLAYVNPQDEEDSMLLLGHEDDAPVSQQDPAYIDSSNVSDYETSSSFDTGSKQSDSDASEAVATRRSQADHPTLVVPSADIIGGTTETPLLHRLSLSNPTSVFTASSPTDTHRSSPDGSISPTRAPRLSPFGAHVGINHGHRRGRSNNDIGNNRGVYRMKRHIGPATPLQRAVLQLGTFASGVHFPVSRHGHGSQLQVAALELFVCALQYLRPSHIHASVVDHVLAVLCSVPQASILRVHYVKALLTIFGRGTEPGLQQSTQPQSVPNVSLQIHHILYLFNMRESQLARSVVVAIHDILQVHLS